MIAPPGIQAQTVKLTQTIVLQPRVRMEVFVQTTLMAILVTVPLDIQAQTVK